MKKKIMLLLCFVVVMGIIFTGCSSDVNSSSNGEGTAAQVSKENIKIGFVHFADPSDRGYTYNHEQATLKMAEDLGIDDSQIISKYNIPENSEAETAIRELAEEGCQIIFATAHGHEDYMLQVAADYPDITFCHFNGTQAASSGLPNMHNYFGEISQIRYLSGIVAGLTTKTNKIGYVAAMNFTETNNGLDAYYLGALSVNPDIEVSVVYMNKWYDVALEGQATKSLLDSGCDVISHHADSTAGAITCEENGAFFIPYNSDMTSVAKDAVLTAVRWDTSSYLEMAVENVIAGKKDEIPVDYTGTIENGMIYLDDINYSLLDEETAAKVQSAVETAKEGFISGELYVFTGPLYDQEGNEILGDGEVYEEELSAPTFGDILQGIHIME